MKKILVVFLLLAGFCADAQEVYTSSGRPVGDKRRNQKQDKGFDPDNLIFGGGLMLQFGDVTNVSLSPVIGYRFSDKFAAGIGIGYTYYRIKNFFEVQNPTTLQYEFRHFKAHSLSTSLWARYLIFDNVFIQVQPEYNMAWYKNYTFYGKELKESQAVPSILVGAGMRFPISDRASMVGMLMYDVLQDPLSPYRNTVVPLFGFNIGF